MSHLQDKICNALTLAGLVGIIVWGTASLIPEAEATPLSSDEAIEEQPATPLDTLPELPPATEVMPEAADTVQPDTLQPDTAASPADTVVSADTVKTPVVPVHQEAESGEAHSPATAHPADTLDQ